MSNDLDEKNLQQCKVFVGGLSLETTNETLKDYFCVYGGILDAIVMRDGATKKSRGFGFVTFSDPESVEECLGAKPHVLDSKEVEVKRAVPREDTTPSVPSVRTKKVFLGGLSPDTSKEDAIEALEKFGKLIDVQIMTDKHTNKPRGFGFAIFDDFEVVDRLCSKRYCRIKDRDVELKKAVSQEEIRRNEMERTSRPPMVPSDGYGYGYGGRGGDPYGRPPAMYSKMAAYGGEYSRYPAYAEYPRYPAGDYIRPDYAAGSYTMAYDRAAGGYQGYGASGYSRGYPSQGYDMGSYGNMYGQSAAPMPNTYAHSPSNYGPARGMFGMDKDKERGGRTGGFHPYRR